MNKPFSPSLHADNDLRAREAVKGYLLKRGRYVWDNGNQYGIDLVVGTHFPVEVEVSSNWESGSFPFSTVHIPERKKKFATNWYGQFWRLRKDLKAAVIVKSEDLLTEYLKEIPNRLMPEGERFFDVPKSKCREVVL